MQWKRSVRWTVLLAMLALALPAAVLPSAAAPQSQQPEAITCGDSATCSTSYAALKINNSGTGPAIYGNHTAPGWGRYGIRGYGSPGVYGSSWGYPGVQGKSTTGIGVRGESTDGPGVLATSVNGDGVSVSSPGGTGVYVGSAGVDGVSVYSASDDGVEVTFAGGDGVYVWSALQHGMLVEAAAEGVRVAWAGGDGFSVGSAVDDGFYVFTAGDDGVEVTFAGGDGVYVASAGDDGVQVNAADDDGVYLNDVGADGVQVVSAAGFGVYVNSAGYDGAYANTEQANHEWGFRTPDAIYAGSALASGGPSMIVAQNGDGAALEPGMVVAVSGRGAPFGESGVPAPLVGRAGGDRGAVAGVVYARFVAEERVEEVEREEQVEQRIRLRSHSVEGPAAPGEYLLVVVLGPAQVRASGAAGGIAAGELLTVGGDGQAVRMGEGYRPGQVVGTAMDGWEAAQGSGLIWVLVNPR